MGHPYQETNFKANGDVEPMRAIKYSSTEGRVEHATDGSAPYVGVSAKGSKKFPESGNPTRIAAVGDPCPVICAHGLVVPVVSGNTFSYGAPLMATTAGKVITCTSGNYILGYAEEAATAADQEIKVRLTPLAGKLA